MKKILKQKFFLIGVLLLLIAIGVGIGNGCRQNSVKAVETFTKAVLSSNPEKAAKAIAPSQMEKMETLGMTMSTIVNLLGTSEKPADQDIKMLQGSLILDTDGKPASIKVVTLIPGTEKIKISSQEMKLLEEDGKLYLDMLGF